MEQQQQQNAAARRKSLGRLKDMTVAWDVDPQGNKYTRNDDTEPCCPSGRTLGGDLQRPSSAVTAAATTDTAATTVKTAAADCLVDVELTRKQPSVSAMEVESIKERERASKLRKCAQHLELESVNGKYTRENFKRGILNKVSRIFLCFYLPDSNIDKIL